MEREQTRKVTYASLCTAARECSVYRVYRGVLHNAAHPQSEQYLDLNEPGTLLVGQVVTLIDNGSLIRPDYLMMAKVFETPEYPAFTFVQIGVSGRKVTDA